MEQEILVNDNPKSSFSESIKTIRTNLQFSNVDKNNKIILISSPNPGDGKSFITANLATAYAQENKKVLIIDSDLRKGRQHRIFELKNNKEKGYSNLILNVNNKKLNLSEYIVKTKILNVDLLTCGAVPPSPTEMLASSNNEKLLSMLSKKYDYIFLDCPPVLGINDTLIMSKYSDLNVIVISSKKTKIESLEEVKKAFEKTGSKINGVVLNKVLKKHSSYYGYYGEQE